MLSLASNGVMTLTDIVILQVGADSFPPFVASTGVAAIMACEKLACFGAPMLFEALRTHTGHFQTLFTLISGLWGMAFLLLVLVPVNLMPYDPNTGDESEQCLEMTSMR